MTACGPQAWKRVTAPLVHVGVRSSVKVSIPISQGWIKRVAEGGAGERSKLGAELQAAEAEAEAAAAEQRAKEAEE
jgi:hypothetical protein